MAKNWLIRTQSNKIFGPVTREKVVELISNQSLKGRDEICAGNGHWIFIEETELVNKFLDRGEPQPFNPISEAQDADLSDLFASYATVEEKNVTDDSKPVDEEVVLPSNKDLEFPDMGPGSTMHSTPEESFVEENDNNDEEKTLLPSNDDLTFPDLSITQDTAVVDVEQLSSPSQNNVDPASESEDEEKKLPDDDDLAFPDD